MLNLVLHAHLPFVRHPEHEDFFEEGWLREAILESYIPLLWALEGLAEEGVPYRLTLSLSPTLVAMFDDALLRARFIRHLDRLCDLVEKEVRRTTYLPEYHETALLYRERFMRARRDYQDRWHADLAGAFRRLSEAGHLELITCGATHGYLPLMAQNALAVRAQIVVAVEQHRARFGSTPLGFWLPECGYYQGVDAELSNAGIRYTILETHAIDHAIDAPAHGVHAPVLSPSGLAIFGRSPECTKQVWSSKEGYPGDVDYREYYRDVGFDLHPKLLGACSHPLGIRRALGIKYHRVTGHTEAKDYYVRAHALAKARTHAEHFHAKCRQLIAAQETVMTTEPALVAPYDAELFGHWWFEGPDWLAALLRELAADPSGPRATTPGDCLATYSKLEAATPAQSSWGHKGYSEMWLNASNDWIYPHLHEAADSMVSLAARHANAEGLLEAALNQAARELLLAQASDWAFIMSQRTVVEYAVRRTKEHLGRFRTLARMIESKQLDPERLSAITATDNLFPELDFRVYRSDYVPRFIDERGAGRAQSVRTSALPLPNEGSA
jgi:1,4-alpha-glucan branching enzyme